jgi:hypothetical protein
MLKDHPSVQLFGNHHWYDLDCVSIVLPSWLSRLRKNSRQATVGALYERPFFRESMKIGRSQTAPTASRVNKLSFSAVW